MLLSRRNIVLFRIFFGILVLGASSGATAVLRHCRMETMSCCSSSAGDDACDQPLALPAGHAVRADFTCQTTTVVGGLTINQALVEKEKKPESLKLFAPVVASPGLHCSLQLVSPSLTLLVGPPLSPPTVEKYVLNGSFRI